MLYEVITSENGTLPLNGLTETLKLKIAELIKSEELSVTGRL